MKNTLFSFFACTIIIPLFAQDTKFGVKGGLNIANEKVKSGSFSFKGESIASFHIGVVLDAALSDNLYVQPQLMLTGKGSRSNDLVFRPYYLELPVNILYKVEVSDGIKIYGGVGPGIAIGVFGKLKDLDLNGSRNLRFGETTNSDYKTVDFTGGFEAGVELNDKLGIGIGYRWSFLDVTQGSNKVTHKVVNFSLAYFFGEGGSRKKKPSSGSRSSSSNTRTSTKRN